MAGAPTSSHARGLGSLAPNHSIPTRSPTPAPEGNPVAVLSQRGITEENETNILALASAFESFGDFKRGPSS